MKKIRNIIIIIIILGIWGWLITIFYKEKVQLSKEETPQYVVLDGNYFFEYENGKWDNLSLDNEYDLINWKKFDIFIDNIYYNTFNYVVNDNHNSYFFNDDNISHDVPESYVLINDDSFLSIIEYNQVEFMDEDYEIATDFLESHNFRDIDLTRVKKYYIPGDGYVYVVYNYKDTTNLDDIYHVVFYRRGNKNYMIAKGNYEFNYDLHTVLDINKKFNNFILSYTCYDGLCYEMYQYKDGNYVNVLE